MISRNGLKVRYKLKTYRERKRVFVTDGNDFAF